MGKAETRIAVFYPWTGLPALDRGSARRVVPLVRLLAERYNEVRVVSPGARFKRWKFGNVEYHFQRPSAIERLWLRAAFVVFDGAFHHLFRGRVTARERRQWWHYLSADFQWGLTHETRQAVSWSSVVLLEYPFWEKAVLASCAAKHKKSLLTMHDTLSDSIGGSAWLRAKVRNRELSAARKASSVFCVSESDRQRFAAEGITAQFVPHGMDIHPRKRDLVPESPELRQVEAATRLRQNSVSLCRQQLACKPGGCGGNSQDGGRSGAAWRFPICDCGILSAQGNLQGPCRWLRSCGRGCSRSTLSCCRHCSGALEVGHGNVAQGARSVRS